MRKVLFLLSFLIVSVASFAQVVYVQQYCKSYNSFIELTFADGSKNTYKFEEPPMIGTKKVKLVDVNSGKTLKVDTRKVESYKVWRADDQEHPFVAVKRSVFARLDQTKPREVFVSCLFSSEHVQVMYNLTSCYYDEDGHFHVLNGGYCIAKMPEQAITYFGFDHGVVQGDKYRAKWVERMLHFFGDDPVLKADLEAGVFDSTQNPVSVASEYNPNRKK